jgi:hypothetical protein
VVQKVQAVQIVEAVSIERSKGFIKLTAVCDVEHALGLRLPIKRDAGRIVVLALLLLESW